jgi:sec-independent protein translocase protein TatA
MGEFKKAQMASEMQLTHFGAYTRKDENKSILKDNEEDKENNETSSQEKDEEIEVKS